MDGKRAIWAFGMAQLAPSKTGLVSRPIEIARLSGSRSQAHVPGGVVTDERSNKPFDRVKVDPMRF